jgi:hypothetical protein
MSEPVDFTTFKNQVITCLNGLEWTAEPPPNEIQKDNSETNELGRQNRRFIYWFAIIIGICQFLVFAFTLYLPAMLFSEFSNEPGKIPSFRDSYKAALGGAVVNGKIENPNIIEVIGVIGFVIAYFGLAVVIEKEAWIKLIHDWRYYNEANENGKYDDYFRDECNEITGDNTMVLALAMYLVFAIVGIFFFAWVFSDHPTDDDAFPYLQYYIITNTTMATLIIILFISYAIVFWYHEGRYGYKCDYFIKPNPNPNPQVEPFNSTGFIAKR